MRVQAGHVQAAGLQEHLLARQHLVTLPVQVRLLVLSETLTPGTDDVVGDVGVLVVQPFVGAGAAAGAGGPLVRLPGEGVAAGERGPLGPGVVGDAQRNDVVQLRFQFRRRPELKTRLLVSTACSWSRTQALTSMFHSGSVHDAM